MGASSAVVSSVPCQLAVLVCDRSHARCTVDYLICHRTVSGKIICEFVYSVRALRSTNCVKMLLCDSWRSYDLKRASVADHEDFKLKVGRFTIR